MALRNQPYIPLYVQDFLTDEKLNECSASTVGVYIKLMCLMHKSEEYGKIKLKAKYKQNESKTMPEQFTEMLRKHLPSFTDDICPAIEELIEEEVCYFKDGFLCQKRMLKDGKLSIDRAKAGSKGGKVGRNSGTKRYYNEPGYLYLLYDRDDLEAFKVGISKEPDKRIKGIIRKTKRENLSFRRKWYVSDMGLAEQDVLDFYEDIRDGEWIYGEYSVEDIEKQIETIIKSKLKANSEDENEYVYETES